MFQHPKFVLIICVQDETLAGHTVGVNIILSLLSVNSWGIKYGNSRRLGIINKFLNAGIQNYTKILTCN
jgi:hypothetical protein